MGHKLPWRVLGLSVLAWTSGLGCLGQIGSPSADPNQGQCGGSIGVTPLRRLTRFEYNNTVRDLLGDTTAPASAFPLDEVRSGFDNNAAALGVSPVQTEAFMNAAETLSKSALTTPANFLACDASKLTNTSDEDACAGKFIASFGKKAFRRPPAAEDQTRLMDVFHAGRSAGDFLTGIRYVMETILQSPQFLYRVELSTPADASSKIVPLDSWEMATRLSYLLWGTMPDDALFAAAEADQLTKTEQLRAQVTRMLADPRAHQSVQHFNDQWLLLSKMATMEKDPKIFPSFSPSLVPMMQEETRRFVDEIMWGQKGDLHELLTANYSFMNATLASFYGVSGPTGSDYVRVDLDANRAGILTQGGVLSMLAKANQTAPVQRGKFVREQLLCGVMPPPPPNVPKLPDLSPTLTTRERLAQHSTDPVCHSCHRLMDPIGLGLEAFDGNGLYRTTENGKPVDTSGEIQDADVAGPFNGAAELGQKLASSLFVQKCVVTSWFHYAYARVETTEDACTIQSLATRFSSSGYRFQDLLVALTETDAFRFRRVAGGAQ